MEDGIIQRYADLKREIEADEEALKEKKAEYDRMARDVLSYMERNGTSSVKTTAGTVYMERKVWARLKPAVAMTEVRACFERMGWGVLIDETVNVQSLSAAVRQEQNEERELPDDVKDVLAITEVFQAKVRK